MLEVPNKQKGINERIRKFEIYQNKSIISFYQFFRNITTVSLGFLALFISLKPETFNNIHSKYLFVSTTLLFGMSVLFSLITQHGEQDINHRSAKARVKILFDYMKNESTSIQQSELVKKKWFYKFSEKTTYFCLSFSVISLVLYSYYLVF